jgi:hypothetical protein
MVTSLPSSISEQIITNKPDVTKSLSCMVSTSRETMQCAPTL